MHADGLDDLLCTCCGRLYQEAKGCPSTGIPAGTPWEAVPAKWRCPDCGAARAAYESVSLIYHRAYCALADV